jgi:hypothetical protein
MCLEFLYLYIEQQTHDKIIEVSQYRYRINIAPSHMNI